MAHSKGNPTQVYPVHPVPKSFRFKTCNFISVRDKRRDLSLGQKAMARLKMEEVVSQLQAEAQKRKRSSLKKGSSSPLPSADGNGELQRTTDNEGDGIDKPDAELQQAHNKHAHATLAELGQLRIVISEVCPRIPLKIRVEMGIQADLVC